MPQGIKISVTSRLNILDLSNQKLRLVPAIDQSQMLTEIKFDNNLLTSLPLRIEMIKSLRVLSANKNRIFDIPESLVKSNLEELYLNYNLIERLPYQIGDLVTLRVFQIRNNLFSQVPKSFGNLKIDVKFDWLEYVNVFDIKLLCS